MGAIASPPFLKFPVFACPMSNETTSSFSFTLSQLGKRRDCRIRQLTVTTRRPNKLDIIRAVEESQENGEAEVPSTEATTAEESQPVSALSDSSAELGSKIKEAMKQRKEEKEQDLWSGVLEEIGEIEWPAFGKVLGTTGVVLGVIAGSGIVLLTVNAVLAELSDRVFAGRGVQDFFS